MGIWGPNLAQPLSMTSVSKFKGCDFEMLTKQFARSKYIPAAEAVEIINLDL